MTAPTDRILRQTGRGRETGPARVVPFPARTSDAGPQRFAAEPPRDPAGRPEGAAPKRTSPVPPAAPSRRPPRPAALAGAAVLLLLVMVLGALFL